MASLSPPSSLSVIQLCKSWLVRLRMDANPVSIIKFRQLKIWNWNPEASQQHANLSSMEHLRKRGNGRTSWRGRETKKREAFQSPQPVFLPSCSCDTSLSPYNKFLCVNSPWVACYLKPRPLNNHTPIY